MHTFYLTDAYASVRSHFGKMLRGEQRVLSECFTRHREGCIARAALFDVPLTKNSDGTEQVDNKVIEDNLALIHDLSVGLCFKIPTTLQFAKSLARLDVLYKFEMSRTSSRRAQLVWVQYEGEKIHHVLSTVNRRCARSRTSKNSQIEHLEGHLLENARHHRGPDRPAPPRPHNP